MIISIIKALDASFGCFDENAFAIWAVLAALLSLGLATSGGKLG
jgi:hypothetical protein